MADKCTPFCIFKYLTLKFRHKQRIQFVQKLSPKTYVIPASFSFVFIFVQSEDIYIGKISPSYFRHSERASSNVISVV